MILVDTSIWIEHFRRGHSGLSAWLSEARVVIHSFVIEELAAGHLKDRNAIVSLLATLPQATTITHDEFLYFIDHHRLFGSGLGVVDLHLLASASTCHAKFATLDRRLRQAAHRLGMDRH